MYKIFSLTFIASIVRLLFSLLFTKCVAFFFGPAGLLFFSNFQNVLQLSSRVSNFAVETGVATLVSKNNENPEKIISSTYFLFAIASLFNLLIFFCFGSSIFDDVINVKGEFSNEYKFGVIICLIIFAPLVGLVANLISISNGLERTSVYTKAIVATSLCNLASLSLFLLINSPLLVVCLWGASQSLFIIFFYTFIGRHRNVMFQFKWRDVDGKAIKELLSFSKMTFVSIMVSLLSVLVFRHYVVSTIPLQEAGSWQAVVKLTETVNNMLFIGVTFYLIPKCKNISTWSMFFSVVKPLFLFMSACYFMGIFFLGFFSDWVMALLFSKEFTLDYQFILIQFLGGYIHLMALTLGVVLVVNKVTRFHYTSQFTSMFCVILLGYIFVKQFYLLGAVVSYCVSSSLLFVLNLYFAKKWFSTQRVSV